LRAREVLIALNLTEALSRSDVCRLAARFDDWWPASDRVSPNVLGVAPDSLACARDIASRSSSLAASEERAAAALGARIVVRGEPDYPAELEQLEHPPPAFYLRGTWPSAHGVAIVGPRNADPWGLDAAEWFAQDLARRGLLVISGFARGVDAAAHRGALATPEGRTLAVLGCGLDVPYPRQHYGLAGEIARRGAVISEFPLGREPAQWHFPVRNRLIAALATATVVIQASKRSGALITARYALELGREVLALPGRIGDPRSAGSNLLLRDGAHVALDPEDVVLALPLHARPAPAPSTAATAHEPLLELLGRSPLAVDEIATRLGVPVERVLAKLAELELLGQVRRLPGAAWGPARR
jgi:DNA processing protein